MLPWNFKSLMPSGEGPAQAWHNSARGGLGKHCRVTGDTCLHLFTPGFTSTSAGSKECQDGERGSRETFAETKLPLCLTDTDLSASLGLRDGCYIGQPGFFCTLLSATARLGLRQVIPYQVWVSARVPNGPSSMVSFHIPA